MKYILRKNNNHKISVVDAVAGMPATFGRWLPERRVPVFPLALIGISICITMILGLETYLQMKFPESSIMARLHHRGLLPDYGAEFAPNKGIWHVTGWVGTFLMIIMHVYSLRKKIPFMSEWGMLKHWLDFHIFCGIMGPVLVTYHTTFRVGGIVSVSYWSTVAVALSGLFGRYIFGLIPRGIAGNALEMEEIERARDYMTYRIQTFYRRAQNLSSLIEKYLPDTFQPGDNALTSLMKLMMNRYETFWRLRRFKRLLRRRLKLPRQEREQLMWILRERLKLGRRINFLNSAQRLFLYWHRIHIICTAALYLIAAVHIVIYFLFRVKP